MVFTFDLSIPEIYQRLRTAFSQFRKNLQNPSRADEFGGYERGTLTLHPAPGEIPSDFRPLPGQSDLQSPAPKPVRLTNERAANTEKDNRPASPVNSPAASTVSPASVEEQSRGQLCRPGHRG